MNTNLVSIFYQIIMAMLPFYVLFIQENMYGDYINDELSVSCFWTKRFKEGYQYLLGILNDNRFENEKERLLTNQKHFQDNLGIEHD